MNPLGIKTKKIKGLGIISKTFNPRISKKYIKKRGFFLIQRRKANTIDRKCSLLSWVTFQLKLITS